MKFLRTASTARLLAAIVAVLVTIAGGTAIAVAATSGGPVPAPSPLPTAIHRALSAAPVDGVSADISFTNNLIDSSDFTGQQSDPLLQGGSGRLWWSDAGELRLELQSDNGDAQVVVDHRSFWISDPAENVVYEGTLPAGQGDSGGSASSSHGVPTITAIKSELSRLMGGLDISGAQPTDVGGQPAYQVTVSPKTNGGLLGSVQLAWDATHGVPLSFAVYARGVSSPVLALSASDISYGPVAGSVFSISPPAGAKVVQLGSLMGSGSSAGTGVGSGSSGTAKGGFWAVFDMHALHSLDGQTLQSTKPIGHPDAKAVVLRYGTGLGAITVVESGSSSTASTSASSPGVDGLSLPTRTIDGATATVLSTPLFTVLHLTRDQISYTVIGSITAAQARSAAAQIAQSR